MYLTHITVVLWQNSVGRDNISYGNELISYTIIGNVMITGAVSLILVIAIEMPILHMEKMMFGVLGVTGMPRAKRYPKKENLEKIHD